MTSLGDQGSRSRADDRTVTCWRADPSFGNGNEVHTSQAATATFPASECRGSTKDDNPRRALGWTAGCLKPCGQGRDA